MTEFRFKCNKINIKTDDKTYIEIASDYSYWDDTTISVNINDTESFVENVIQEFKKELMEKLREEIEKED